MAVTRRPRSRPRPLVYFSFRSPYSWLAHHDLTRHHPEAARAVQWRPFWEPDEESERALAETGGRFIYTPMSREKHLYMLGDVRRLANRRGLKVSWPSDRDAWWEPSHLAHLVAEAEGRGPEFIERVYRARWQEGLDISDRRTIGKLAADVGVSAAAERATDDPDLRRRGVEALSDVDHDDVFGVPFFINGRQKFWGLDRLADFLATLDTHDNSDATAPPVGDPPDPPPLSAPRSSDYGHAGGCG
jgi:2-hydroxychromene-2-carboxylate isomerase